MSNFAKFKGKAKLDKKVLEKLQEELKKSKGSMVRLGVLAGHVEREGELQPGQMGPMPAQALNNADIGAVHELGSKDAGIPQRSFLRMPIQNEMAGEVRKIKAVKFVNLILTKGMEFALRTLGVIGEQVVDKAFETRGNGKWEPNSEATIRRKGSDAPLIDSAKLRRSITSKVYMGGQKA